MPTPLENQLLDASGRLQREVRWMRKEIAKENNRPYTIFLDVDGVLADFSKHMMQVFHIETDINSKPSRPIPWDILGYDFYRTLPMIDGAFAAYKHCKRMADTYFLTGITDNPGCASGKMEWLSKFCGKAQSARRRIIMCGSDTKALLAGPKRILIDDRKKSTDAWAENGGIAIWFDIKEGWGPTLETLMKAMEE